MRRNWRQQTLRAARRQRQSVERSKCAVTHAGKAAQGAIPQSAGSGQALADLLARPCPRSRLALECGSTNLCAWTR